MFFFQDALQCQDFTKFQLLKPRYLEIVDKMLAEDIAKLMALIPLEENLNVAEPMVKGTNISLVVFERVLAVRVESGYFCSTWPLDFLSNFVQDI